MNNGNDRGAGFAETGPGPEGFNQCGVRPAADEIPPGEPEYSIDWGSDDPGADPSPDAASYVYYRATYELPDVSDEGDSEWSAKRIGG